MKMMALLTLLLQVASQQPYIETFEVRLHNLDVVVTDRQGKSVSGLTKDDFVILENGAPQEVTNFSAYGESEGSARSAAPAAQAEARAEARATAPRKFIFFIDELALHPSSRNKLLKNAVNLMKSSMQPGDTAAVVRPIGDRNVAQEFTSDPKAIEKAIKDILAASDVRTNTQMATEMRWLNQQLALASTLQEKNFVVRVYSDQARRRVEQRLGRLRAVVGSLAGVEGKKVLVLLTASLAAHPGREAFNLADIKMGSNPEVDNEVPGRLPDYPDLTPQINAVGQLAAANGVTIYALQPDVPLELAAPGAMGTRQLTALSPQTGRPLPPQHSLSDNFFGLVLDNTEITMTALAEKTGGRWFRGDSGVDDAFRQIGNDLRAYYSLAYRAKGSEGGPRRVEVKVKGRDDLVVRTRTDVIEKSEAREMDDLVVASLVYPRQVNELGIRSVAGPLTKTPSNRFQVPVETVVPMKALTFLPAGDGKYRASISVHYAASGQQRDFVTGQERLQDLEITEAEMKSLDGKLFHYTSNLVVSQGKSRIAVGVLDRTAKLSGFSTIEVSTQ